VAVVDYLEPRKPAGATFFGRRGYVADPYGHLWEVAWDRGFIFAEDGS
jgi:uncharacterized glyoxalase superfamily protein PhnB